jgi:lysine-N-methylase
VSALPGRPRLAAHALVRLHVVDGVEVVVIHDARTGDLLRMGPREWALLAGADGTRDFDALVLAAARGGVLRRASELGAVLAALHAAGLLADGIEPPVSPVAPALHEAARPLDALPGFTLTCDEGGACCSLYGSVLFSPLEAARARSLLPEILGAGEREGRAFTPEHGATPDGHLAVALVDGRCAYLAGDGRCGIHAAGGEGAKPRGCRAYPATLVDDGESVRVSVGVECPCVLASVGREGGAPLVDPGARTRGALGADARVVTLPEAIPIADDRLASRAELAAWSRLVMGALPDDGEVVSLLWSLASALDAAGLDHAASLAALAAPRSPAPAALSPWLAALAARARARVAAADTWRGRRDRSRLASHWLAEAAESLLEPAALASALAGASPFGGDERFYLRAQLHGHQLIGDLPLAAALRDRAVRLLLARALPASLPEGDPARPHPLALVEAMMRGHGLAGYARAPRLGG